MMDPSSEGVNTDPAQYWGWRRSCFFTLVTESYRDCAGCRCHQTQGCSFVEAGAGWPCATGGSLCGVVSVLRFTVCVGTRFHIVLPSKTSACEGALAGEPIARL